VADGAGADRWLLLTGEWLTGGGGRPLGLPSGRTGGPEFVRWRSQPTGPPEGEQRIRFHDAGRGRPLPGRLGFGA
jgi:hypothetical protein